MNPPSILNSVKTSKNEEMKNPPVPDPLLVIVILISLMHGLFLFYLGLHQVTKVPRRDAADCAAIVLVAGIMLSSVAGYYAGAAGLFPHM